VLDEHQGFEREFPEFGEAIHALKSGNFEFARLLKAYDETNDEICRIEAQIETPSDAYTEELKIRRVHLKDRLYAMVQAWASDGD
jgi:uncharacterized protein YdcH (DUF465 family)